MENTERTENTGKLLDGYLRHCNHMAEIRHYTQAMTHVTATEARLRQCLGAHSLFAYDHNSGELAGARMMRFLNFAHSQIRDFLWKCVDNKNGKSPVVRDPCFLKPMGIDNLYDTEEKLLAAVPWEISSGLAADFMGKELCIVPFRWRYTWATATAGEETEVEERHVDGIAVYGTITASVIMARPKSEKDNDLELWTCSNSEPLNAMLAKAATDWNSYAIGHSPSDVLAQVVWLAINAARLIEANEANGGRS